MPESKHLYLISHYFYPYAGVGIQRHAYFVRFMAESGLNITLFKAATSYYDTVLEEDDYNVDLNLIEVGTKLKDPTEKDWIGAYKSAIEQRIMSDGAPFVIVFSAGPYFYLRIGPYFKGKFGLPYIIDFRDTPFNSLGLYERHGRKTLKKGLRKLLLALNDPNRKAILKADRLVTITESEKMVLLKHYRNLKPDLISVVFNGFDDTVISIQEETRIAVKNIEDPLRIGIFGKFDYYSRDDARALLVALERIGRERKVLLSLIGSEEPFFSEATISENITINQTGFISYANGIELLKKCNICVLNHRSANSHGTKIFDYIGLNKPIIAFSAKDSEISELLSGFDNAYLVSDAEGFCDSVLSIVNKEGWVLGTGENLVQYSRHSQAEKFLNLVRSI